MGREAFVEEVRKWRTENGNTIFSQYKRLGVSFAWDRPAYTQDDSYVKAVYRAFNILFKDGLIYRGNRVTNWCPRCLTSLSDSRSNTKKPTAIYIQSITRQPTAVS